MQELRRLISSVRRTVDFLVKGIELTDGDFETLRHNCDAAERELDALEPKQETDQE